MTAALDRHPGSDGPLWSELLGAAAEFARMIAPTSFAPDAYRGKPAEIAGCVMMGDELGIGPMTALSKIDIVKGRPAPRAELARALVLRAGHELWLEDVTASRVTACGRRRGSDQVHRVTWTMDDAKRAGLAGSQTWRQYPRQMLTARATAELVRQMAPDVLAGIGLFAEEIDDDATDVGALEEATTADTPATPKQRRKRAAPKTKHADAEPAATSSSPAPPPLDGLDLDEPLHPPKALPVAPTADARGALPEQPTTRQMRAIHAGLGTNGIDDRDDRLAFVSAAIGHRVESSKDITRDEAGRVLDMLNLLERGALTINVVDGDEWALATQDDDTW